MRWLLAFLACIGIAQAQIIQHQISDDGYARVPLQFSFPYYGRVFTESFMFSNGVVGFLNPTNSWCCTGFDLRNNNGTPFSFAIMPLQTDLLNYSGRFLTEGTPQYQRYKWENISEFGRPQNLNTFGVEIRPSGYIGMHYEQVNISPDRPVTIGRTGDVGEFHQYYHGAGFSQGSFNHITESTGNLCLVNPLSSPSCPNYAQAYQDQQCSLNPLYSPSCAGYEVAYHNQQCSLNPLYATTCQGYREVYHAQQCGLNPLYATTCTGYRQAYYNQQCSLNALYDSGCVGYEAAYFNQQCGLNPLYSSGCQGYETAYFNYQCTQNPLYSSQCTGYEQAYFNQQCSINALFNSQCQGYAEAYALANIVSPSRPIAIPQVQVSTTGTISVETPIVADRIVNEVITRPVNNATNPPPSTVQSNATQAEQKPEKKQESKQAPKQTATAKSEIPTQAIPQPVHEYKAPIILDLAYQRMVKKPIQDNGRAMYNLIMNSQIKHEEMVDGQYRKGN